MIAALEQGFAVLEHQRAALLADLAPLSAEQARWRPQPGQWSSAQVVQHLVLTERAIGAPILAPEFPPAARRTVANRLALPLVTAILRFRIDVAVPSRAMVPEAEPELADAIAAWAELRQKLRLFLARVTPAQTAAAIFRHPVGGPFDTPTYLRLNHLHVESHQGQLRALRRACNR